MVEERKRELLSELAAMERASPVRAVRNPIDVVPHLVQRYGKRRTEVFVVITLDGSHKVIRSRVVSSGLVNRTLVHPREVFRGAIRDNAVAVIVAHNHPSGNPRPSLEDYEVTHSIVEAGRVVGIVVLDHIVFCPNGAHVSLREEGAELG